MTKTILPGYDNISLLFTVKTAFWNKTHKNLSHLWDTIPVTVAAKQLIFFLVKSTEGAKKMSTEISNTAAQISDKCYNNIKTLMNS